MLGFVFEINCFPVPKLNLTLNEGASPLEKSNVVIFDDALALVSVLIKFEEKFKEKFGTKRLFKYAIPRRSCDCAHY